MSWALLLPLALRAAEAPSPIVLRDVSAATGVHFRHTDGASGQRYIVEYVSAGVATFDFDGDGDEDLYFLNGAPQPPDSATGSPPQNALYRNDGDFRFTDVTAEAGVGDTGHGLGVVSGDFDNDGDLDLYINNFGPNVLYRNNGDGTFTNVTEQAGVACGATVGAGCSFFDMDADGDLDLYVANYVQFSYATHRPHTLLGIPSYPSPLDYAGEPDVLFRNNGDGSFTDVSIESGIGQHAGTGMGMICADFDNDGDSDVYVCNDVMANFLFENDGKGVFQEVGLLSGAAFDLSGTPQGSMGADAADMDHDGDLDLLATSYGGEMTTLYRNVGTHLFEDVSRQCGVGAPTMPHVTWGHGFVDFDNDGHRDIYIACGDLDDNVELRKDVTAYELTNLLLANDGKGRFRDVSAASGDGLQVRRSSRGAAFDDLDGDGRIDVVVQNSRQTPTILRNDSPPTNHWIQIRVVGTAANRHAVGSRVEVAYGDQVSVGEVHAGRSYQSHFGMRLHFGLGPSRHVDRIRIRWLGGGEDELTEVAANQSVTIIQSGR